MSATSIAAYIRPIHRGDRFSVAIYVDAGQTPGALLIHSASTAVRGVGWNRAAIAHTILAPHTTYWLAYNSSGSADTLFYARNGRGAHVWSTPITFGAWPANFPNPSWTSRHPYLIQVTLTEFHAATIQGVRPTPIKPRTAIPTATASATSTPTPIPSGCQFQKADQPLNIAFCDTFVAPAGTGNRSGDLNGLFWGVSRTTQNVNIGKGVYDGWFPANRQICGTTQLVQPEHDITICNGQMVEATNDGGSFHAGGFTTLAMYPTQPFDIAGRTGTAVFNVSADSEGPHAAWPSFVYTDQPVPAPTGNHTTTNAYAQNSFGFALDADPASCGGGNMTGVGEIFATSAYVYRALTFTPVNNCITYQAGQLNHIEVRISQSRVEIWGTNAGSTTLQELGYVANAGLTLSRGLIWLEDQHYNACKLNTQCTHTFVWDNVGFDGPTLPRDLHLDVNDALDPAGDGSLNLGWYAPDPSLGTPLTLHVAGATNLAQASAALLTLNFFPYNTQNLQYRLNGHAWHTLVWPYPDNTTYAWRTIAIPVSLSEVQAGTNTVDLEATNGGTTVANIDLILVGAQGIVPYTG